MKKELLNEVSRIKSMMKQMNEIGTYKDWEGGADGSGNRSGGPQIEWENLGDIVREKRDGFSPSPRLVVKYISTDGYDKSSGLCYLGGDYPQTEDFYNNPFDDKNDIIRTNHRGVNENRWLVVGKNGVQFESHNYIDLDDINDAIKETGDIKFVSKLINKLSAEAEEHRKNEPEPTSDYADEPSDEDF